MPKPRFCSNPQCGNHHRRGSDWCVRFGSYRTIAHGSVPRYRCRSCGRTVSDQTESIHYYAKRRLPLRAIADSLLAGASQREVARRYHVSPMAIQQAVLRLGRQAMAAQMMMLDHLPPIGGIACDGLRSFVSSQDYPCDLTTVVSTDAEVVLSIDHAVMRRSGRMTAGQKRRVAKKYRVWRPQAGSVRRSIARIGTQITEYLRPVGHTAAIIDTDEHPAYLRMIADHPVCEHLRRCGLLEHIRTPSPVHRSTTNRLFPVNYLDRLLRHRLKEHTRETIAFGRHTVMQMHRAWLFAWDHNVRREYRAKHPRMGVHGQRLGIEAGFLTRVGRDFFTRRLRPRGCVVPESIGIVWLGEAATPPIRWRRGQRGSSVRIPAYARRDLMQMDQHAR